MKLLLFILGALLAVNSSALADGGDAPMKPCGEVSLIPTGHQLNGLAVLQNVSVDIKFPDGDVEHADFPYPFEYPSQSADPFLSDDSGATLVQQPPVGTDISKLPEPIQYVLSHTDSRGYTTLTACSKADEDAARSARARRYALQAQRDEAQALAKRVAQERPSAATMRRKCLTEYDMNSCAAAVLDYRDLVSDDVARTDNKAACRDRLGEAASILMFAQLRGSNEDYMADLYLGQILDNCSGKIRETALYIRRRLHGL